ncbi:MAG: glycogen synthase [Treponema sp.]|jgi:starch synthase|nr:glycogen synthase [Treponema sp.]
MNVLFASSEAYPFFTSGKLGDMTGSLATSLRRLQVDIRVILPLYDDMKAEWRKLMRYVTNFTVPVSWRNQYCGIFELKREGVTYYFLDNEYYFKRPGFYGYYDDGERFAFFARAVLEAIRHFDFAPDILHCNDWQTALSPVYLNLKYRCYAKFVRMKSIFTIHDVQYQGKYGPEMVDGVLGIGNENFCMVEYDGIVNYMKGAIEAADIVSTVSPSYAREILEPWYGYGMDRFLRERDFKLRGILSGIDGKEYNPATDTKIAAPFDADSFAEGKARCKERLQEMFGLNEADIPLIGMVTHFVPHKGPDLLIRAADEIIASGMQLAILGYGDSGYERFFGELAARHSGQCSLRLGFLPDMARNIYAGSDLFLMPSKTEPCGLAQMLALRYGSLPIVRETGGLRDTISEGKNGFVFSAYSADEMRDACFRAKETWQNRKVWDAMVRRAMKSDHSWTSPAKEYAKMYEETLALW